MKWRYQQVLSQPDASHSIAKPGMSKRQTMVLIIIGVVAALSGHLILTQVSFIQSLNDLVLDQFIFHARPMPPHRDLVVVAIDDESAGQLGDPMPRGYYSNLMRKLSAFGASAIAFDLLFRDKREPESDFQLAQVSDSLRHIIHCFTFTDVPAETEQQYDPRFEKFAMPIQGMEHLKLIQARDATFPNDYFMDHFDRAGFVSTEWDIDGRLRRMPLFIEFEDRIYPSFGLATLLAHLNMENPLISIRKNFWGRRAVIETASTTLEIPINDKAQTLLHFYGRFKTLEPQSFAQVLALLNALPENQRSNLATFQDKIVLIGSTETGIDKHPTPFAAEFPGVGFHATFISNVLQKNLITELPAHASAIIVLLLTLGLLAGFIDYNLRGRSMLIFILRAVILIVAVNLIAYLFFFNTFKIWFQLVSINGVIVFLFIALLFYEKIIHLKNLNKKLLQLENDIFLKITAIDRLDQKISSQTEQYKLIQYFTAELRNILTDPSLREQVQLENIFPRFFENQEIIKSKLVAEIEQLKSDKIQLEKEKEKLEFERTVYEKFLRGKKEETNSDIPDSEPIQAPEDRSRLARQAMAALQYFQTMTSRGPGKNCAHFGMIALAKVPDENGQMGLTAMGKIFDNIQQISGFESTVLITGEHGTGKELIARAIHSQSKRAGKAMIVLNCAAIPENLLESELFGHVKGAFTGAISDHKGAFENADSGTIFLDEIGELKPDLQAKLLRVLQEKEIQRVGGSKTIRVDIRVITATNKDLEKCIEKNSFRSDLYFRLNVVNLHLPLLRERQHDIPFLIQHFLDEFNRRYLKKKAFSGDALLAAICYHWPGNVRMLQHLVEKVCVMNKEDLITLAALPADMQEIYQHIFASEEIPWWQQIQQAVRQEQERLLELCKSTIRSESIDEFRQSAQLQDFESGQNNCYEYLNQYVSTMAAIFSVEQREGLVRSTIVEMQEQLLQWCREEKVAKLAELYDKIELMLGRTRRQIDNWRKIVDNDLSGNGKK